MIIRRMFSAIRTQDWSTLMIELAVVVIGIFLGLQVDAWNEARREAARETAYLQRLIADIDQMLSGHEAHVARARSGLDALFVTFGALRSCELEPDAVAPFEESLLNHQGLERLEVVRSTYDEMVASGALARLDDAALKDKISEVYSEAVAAQQFIEYFTADLGRASDIIWRHVSFDLRPEAPDRVAGMDSWRSEDYLLTVSYDIAELCKASTFRNAMVEVFDSRKDRVAVGAAFARELRELRSLIEQRLAGG